MLPGWIDTDLSAARPATDQGLHERARGPNAGCTLGQTPAISPASAAFLVGSQFVTGAAITVDGGYSVNG